MNNSTGLNHPSHSHRHWEIYLRELILKAQRSIKAFVSSNAVLCIAAVLAIATSIIVPPDKAYLEYPDYGTLSCLFGTLAVICALKNIRFFTFLARKIVCMTGNLRSAVLSLIYITFIGSMIIANDMALLTFLPLGYFLLTSTHSEKYMARVFILQNIAANLGGMLTPFGNPQNLYLYSYFNIPTTEFMRIMVLPFLLATAMITLCCLFFPKSPLTLVDNEEIRLPAKRTVFYLAVFAISILMVFRIVPYLIGFIAIVAAILFTYKDALKMVDYGLLATFLCFFIFSGNLARIPEVNLMLSSLLEKNTLLVSALSCQVISNVPSAILLSHFTSDYASLLIGVNIGGAGTLIASLASLITFRTYTEYNPGKALRYVALFSLYNFAFLAILLFFSHLLIQLNFI